MRDIEYLWDEEVDPNNTAAGPSGFVLQAGRGTDSLVLRVQVDHSRTTPREEDLAFFHQMRGSAKVDGSLLGAAVRSTGSGFFETWTRMEEAP